MPRMPLLSVVHNIQGDVRTMLFYAEHRILHNPNDYSADEVLSHDQHDGGKLVALIDAAHAYLGTTPPEFPAVKQGLATSAPSDRRDKGSEPNKPVSEPVASSPVPVPSPPVVSPPSHDPAVPVTPVAAAPAPSAAPASAATEPAAQKPAAAVTAPPVTAPPMTAAPSPVAAPFNPPTAPAAPVIATPSVAAPPAAVSPPASK